MYALKAYNNNPFYKIFYKELKNLSNYIYIYTYYKKFISTLNEHRNRNLYWVIISLYCTTAM